ncbi:amidohydrolase [Gramella sp. BOM4]|nr:amidohydrolase [Christiangramia bathymodioli]
MRLIYKQILLVLIILPVISTAQQTPVSKKTDAVTIVGATAHLGNGECIENSLIIFEDGKLTQVRDANTKMQYRGKIIQAKGKHVYPGFIAANVPLGQIVDSIDPSKIDGKVLKSIISQGFLLGQIVPEGKLVFSTIVKFNPLKRDDLVNKEMNALHITWPKRGEDPDPKNKQYQEDLKKLAIFLKEARMNRVEKKEHINLDYQDMEQVFSDEQKVFVYVNGEKEIRDAIQFKKDHKIKEMVIVGGNQANNVASELAKNEIPVLLNYYNSTLNSRGSDNVFDLAKTLDNQGVLVGLSNRIQMDCSDLKNLPFYTETSAPGLDKEEILKMTTFNTARIMGIDENYGSLEKGKSATLFISEGDAFEIKTNNISHAWIDGREIRMETHQTKLGNRNFKKYKDEEKNKE